MNVVITLQFIAHFIGDYYLQNGTIAQKKNDSYWFTFLHSVIYCVPFYMIWAFIALGDWFLFCYVSLIAWSHCLVDMGKVALHVYQKRKCMTGNKCFISNKFIYILDQLFHYLLLYGISMVWLNGYRIDFTLPIYPLFLCLLGIMLYQPYYVSAKILFCENKCISNAWAYTDCLWKLLGTCLGICFVLCPIWIQLLCVLIGIGSWLCWKKESILYMEGVMLIGLSFRWLLGL